MLVGARRHAPENKARLRLVFWGRRHNPNPTTKLDRFIPCLRAREWQVNRVTCMTDQ